MADVSTSPTNAEEPATIGNGGGDQGLDAPTITLDRSQATTDQFGYNIGIPLPDETGAVGNIRRNPETGELYDTGGLLPPTSPGVGVNDDNSQTRSIAEQDPFAYDDPASVSAGTSPSASIGSGSSTSTVTGAINPNTRAPIVPQPNVLDQFSSYTYQASVYLMTPAQYQALALSHKKSINSYNLLFQSGGAPTNTGGFLGALNSANQSAAGGAITGAAESALAGSSRSAASSGSANAGRNPAFPLDFYIDSITMENLIQGKGTGAAHNVNALKFTVIEPVGITLIDRIYEAVQDSAPTDSTNKVNYQAAQYLMVIRFYGYDQNGNIKSGSPNNSDPRALVEKYIPFNIKTIQWQVSAKATEYHFECVPTGQLIAGGTRRGVVPYDIQLSQGTVGKLLTGTKATTGIDPPAATPGATTTAADDLNAMGDVGNGAPPKANAAATPKPTVQAGLMTAMNEFSKSLTTGKNPVYEIADQYELVFAKGAEDIRDASIVLPQTKKEATKTPMGPTPTKDSKGLNPDTQAKDKSIATQTIYAGQPIVQVIDQVIRNSSYITNQALTIYDEENETPKDDNLKKQKPVDWYSINFQAIPIGNKPDSRRNDYAYKIKFIISKYRIDNYDSKYFPLGTFRGVHKSYPWIFTGNNTAILDYSETLNSAYNLLVSGSDPSNSSAEIERRKRANTLREQFIYTYGPRSSESSQGSRYKANEVGANLADSLYASADIANAKLRIIGDPAWIQQGSIAGGIDETTALTQSFLPDGTINFDAEQILFEVNWARPSDYNLASGVADPASAGPPVSRVYTARKVTSEFKQGKFEQYLEGLLFNIPKPDGSNKATTAPMPAKGDVTRETAARTGLALTPAAAAAARSSFAATDPRRVDKAAAGVGATSTQTVPEPAAPQPVSSQQVDTSTIPPNPNDTIRSAPPPDAPTSGSGEDLGAVINELGEPSRFRRNLETGELYDPGNAEITTPQIQSWEP